MPTITPEQQLDNWIAALKTVKNICGGQFNGNVGTWTLNKFAGSLVGATVGANLVGFGHALAKAFPSTGLGNATFGDQTTFEDVTDAVEPDSLDHIAVVFVQGFSDPSCVIEGVLDVTKTLAAAFPPGTQTFANLTTVIDNTNLDAVIGSPAVVKAGLGALIKAAKTKLVGDLTTYLSTIQP